MLVCWAPDSTQTKEVHQQQAEKARAHCRAPVTVLRRLRASYSRLILATQGATGVFGFFLDAITHQVERVVDGVAEVVGDVGEPVCSVVAVAEVAGHPER